MGKPAGFATDIWIDGDRWRVDVSAGFISAATGIADPTDQDMLTFVDLHERRILKAAAAKMARKCVTGQPIRLRGDDLIA